MEYQYQAVHTETREIMHEISPSLLGIITSANLALKPGQRRKMNK